MKKVIISLMFFLLAVFSVFAQSEDESEISGEFLQQYQTFSWKRVAKAKKYEISIEKQLENGTWEAAASEQTTDNRIEILLYPGNYRVALSVFNALGKKTSTTDWTPFIILNETQPYLYADSLKKSANWQSPLLTVKQASSTTVEEVDDEGSVSAREGDPTNSIFLKGKNIFFPTTTFSLVPKDVATEGRQFEAFFDMREEVPLEILRRDTENSGVVLAYDTNKLYSGYYDVVVKNPGGQSAKLELLIFADEAPQIDTSLFAYNDNYKVNSVSFNKSQEIMFTIKGTGFGNNTEFSLKPDSGFIPYPFESPFERQEIPLTVNSHKSLDTNGTVQVSFSIPQANIFTGYYYLTASNGNIGEDNLLLLVTTTSNSEEAPTVSKLKTKPAKSAGTITYQVMGNNIDSGTKFTLVSAYSEESDKNVRFEVTYVMAKRRGTLHILSGDGKNLEPGTYALLMENENSSDIIYVEVDKNQKFTVDDLSTTEVANLFYRPTEKNKVNEIVLEEKFNFEPLDFKFSEKLPVFASSLNTSFGVMGSLSDPNDVYAQAQLNLLNFNWFRWDVGATYFYSEYWENRGIQAGTDFALEIPGAFLRLYTGAGFYTTVKEFNNDYTSFRRNYSIPMFAGFKFVNFMDFRYTISLENVKSSPDQWFFRDQFSVGANIPYRAYRYTKRVKTTTAVISQNNMIDGTQYKLKKNTKALYLDSPVVTGFNGNAQIQSVKTNVHVKEIGMNAFADCTALTSVELNNGLTKISAGAFKNDTLLESMDIPASVKTIEKGAFDGVDSSFILYLKWNSDDETPRNLEGLNELKNVIFYSDNVLYYTNSSLLNADALKAMETYCSPDAWKFDLNEDAEITAKMVLVKDGKKELSPGICFEGCFDISKKMFSKPQKIVANTDILKEFDFGKSGKPISGIRFKAEGEGDVAFRLYITDYQGNVFNIMENGKSIQSKFDVDLDGINDIKIDEKISQKMSGFYFMVMLDTEDYETSKNYKFTISDIEVY